MQRATACFIILFLGLSVFLYAQDDSPSVEIDWDDYASDLYVRGDQVFIISLGTVFPTIFINNGKLLDHNFSPPVGGAGSLAYSYFLNSMFFIGGELGGMFLPTLGANTVFIIPLGFTGGMQFIVQRFEFPISFAIGMNWHTYLDKGYYGLYAKLGGAAYFRATTEWSFGLSSYWGWFPQWTNEPSKNVDGNFIFLTLSARYHF